MTRLNNIQDDYVNQFNAMMNNNTATEYDKNLIKAKRDYAVTQYDKMFNLPEDEHYTLISEADKTPIVSFVGERLDTSHFNNDVSYKDKFQNIVAALSGMSSLINYTNVLFTYNPRISIYDHFISDGLFPDKFGLKDVYITIDNISDNKVEYDELNNHWNDQLFDEIFISGTETRLTTIYNIIDKAIIDSYGKKEINKLLLIKYKWNETWKIMILQYIKLNGKTYRIHCNISVNDYIDQSIITKGDTSFHGDFTVISPLDNAEIFQVDTLNKNITHQYNVGIGTKNPESILDIQDTTTVDLINMTNVVSENLNDMNDIIYKLRYENNLRTNSTVDSNILPASSRISTNLPFNSNNDTILIAYDEFVPNLSRTKYKKYVGSRWGRRIEYVWRKWVISSPLLSDERNLTGKGWSSDRWDTMTHLPNNNSINVKMTTVKKHPKGFRYNNKMSYNDDININSYSAPIFMIALCNNPDYTPFFRTLPIQETGVVYFQYLSYFEETGGPKIEFINNNVVNGSLLESIDNKIMLIQGSKETYDPTNIFHDSIDQQGRFHLILIRFDYTNNTTDVWINPDVSSFDYTNPSSSTTILHTDYAMSFDKIQITLRANVFVADIIIFKLEENAISKFYSRIRNNLQKYNTELNDKSEKQYVYCYQLKTNTNIEPIVAEDVKVIFHGAHLDWNDLTYKQILDIDTITTSDIIQDNILPELNKNLNSKLLFDGCIYLSEHIFTNGVKRSINRGFVVNDIFYIIGIGVNIQLFNIRTNLNKSITEMFHYMNKQLYFMNYMKYHNTTIDNDSSIINVFNKTVSTYTVEKIQENNPSISTDIDIYYLENSDTKINNIKVRSITSNDNINPSTNLHILPVEKIMNEPNINLRAKYTSFIVNMNKKYNEFHNGDYGIVTYQDNINYYQSIFFVVKKGESSYIYSYYLEYKNYVKDTVSIKGDTKLIGELSVNAGLNITKKSFLTIDPDNSYIGIDTNERFINYADVYTTTASLYNTPHHMIVTNNKYPNIVCERVAESQEKVDNQDYGYFGSYSGATIQRTSHLFLDTELIDYNNKLNNGHLMNGENWHTYKHYGPDISFEIKDKSGTSKELGQMKLVIDKTDDDGNIHAGFGIQVIDNTMNGSSFEGILKNIMYVNNDKELFVNGVMLGGNLLTTKTENDGTTGLYWGVKKVMLEE